VSEAPIDVEGSLDRYREVRRRLEEQVLPLATSVDGRRFSYQSSLFGLGVQAGSYVALEQGSERRLGQIVTLEIARRPTLELASGEDGEPAHRAQVVVRAAEGEGRVLSGDGSPFHDAMMRPATADEVREHLEETAPRRARLGIGELLLADGVPFSLDAGGFGRHTFLCGQSGSGKTYSLGVVLEQLLLETDLRIVVLDPNSDFARLGELRPDADDADAARFGEATRSLEVRRARDGLAVRLAELDAATQAAVLRLDPIADREEYSELTALTDAGEGLTLERLEQVERDGGAGRQLIARARNLGLDRWNIWAGTDAPSLLPELARDDLRCLVVDLGSLATREEQALASAAVLGELWRRREERKPVLIVIDEAHNVCPARPEDPLTAIATEHAVRIAGEGRKFGLYLLVSTQRPQKVHENVLSQCDNLLLMRMNSLADLGFVGETFSFVPPSLLERATTFRQGESLAAGLIAPHPAFLRFGRRIAQEGGGDVPADWSRPVSRPD
jgi:DNA helicase HerA-like ATPase